MSHTGIRRSLRCPECDFHAIKVTDSRWQQKSHSGLSNVIRRRLLCPNKHRFTSYECTGEAIKILSATANHYEVLKKVREICERALEAMP